mgnify:CR=1 FL=1
MVIVLPNLSSYPNQKSHLSPNSLTRKNARHFIIQTQNTQTIRFSQSQKRQPVASLNFSKNLYDQCADKYDIRKSSVKITKKMKKIFMYERNLDYNGQASPTAKVTPPIFFFSIYLSKNQKTQNSSKRFRC